VGENSALESGIEKDRKVDNVREISPAKPMGKESDF